MKLSNATNFNLTESLFIEPFCEAGEAPRWKFNYGSWKEDPTPDILLLGAYQHPNTGNNLVGGINLKYLQQAQRDQLAKVLPQIMAAPNLYSRYHIGKRLLPDIFQHAYRTYNAANIRGVQHDVFYPKYGFMKAAADTLKKKIGGLFKSKDQRAKEAQPQYPDDLKGMNDTLDSVVTKLGQQQAPIAPSAPEIQVARNNYQQLKADQNPSYTDVERQEDQPYIQANHDLQRHQLAQGETTPQAVNPIVTKQILPKIAKPQTQPSISPQQLGQSFEKERTESQKELLDPKNDIDLDESIRYYCPRVKQYIVESINIADELPSLEQQLYNLSDSLIAAAQKVYDKWEPEDEYDSGGICDLISDAMGDVLTQRSVDYTIGGHDGDDHSYLIAYDSNDSLAVDIDPYTYETGGGYSWTKVPEVVFTVDDLIISRVHRPDWI